MYDTIQRNVLDLVAACVEMYLACHAALFFKSGIIQLNSR